jgi:hypothetical protein
MGSAGEIGNTQPDPAEGGGRWRGRGFVWVGIWPDSAAKACKYEVALCLAPSDWMAPDPQLHCKYN